MDKLDGISILSPKNVLVCLLGGVRMIESQFSGDCMILHQILFSVLFSRNQFARADKEEKAFLLLERDAKSVQKQGEEGIVLENSNGC